jgi:hypothetical protein
MALGDDERRFVNDRTIGLDLPRQSYKRVRFSFDFETTDMPVNDSNIDATSAMTETKFINDQGVVTGFGMAQQLAVGRPSDVAIPE